MILKILRYGAIGALLLLLTLGAYSYYVVASFDTTNLPERHGQVNAQLFLGAGENQPLIVGLGGAEGGNAWASDYWKKQRTSYLENGYAFLAIGYFGMPDTPENLDRIALEGIREAIADAANNPKVDADCIAVMGGSKGGELALTLASRYAEIKAVVGIVAANAVFAGLTDAMTTSSFTHERQQIPFVPVPWSATPALLTGNLRGAFETMLEDRAAWQAAEIPVERVNGPIFLISATQDEFWPSSEMSDRIVERLQGNRFAFHYEHVAIDGDHAEPLNHFDKIDRFLDTHFKADQITGCARHSSRSPNMQSDR